MSIIIKNEKMPNKCSECKFCGLAGRRMERLLCMFTLKSEVHELIDNRLPECPLVKFPENEDAISRQAAIDIFDDYNVSVENGELEAYKRDRKRLCDLPSAQPEITLELAIDYLHSIGWMQEHDRILTESAQPEIIRCKDCRWQKDQSGSTEWLPCRAIVTPSDFYCARAERRTDE